MSGANVGGDDVRLAEVDTGDAMAAFDALPEEIRRFSANMAINWVGTDIKTVVDRNGPAVCLRALKKTEADMQAAHRARIAA